MVGLTLQDLFNQVIDDVAVISREAGNETSDVVSTTLSLSQLSVVGLWNSVS